jgi:hypothetical protein
VVTVLENAKGSLLIRVPKPALAPSLLTANLSSSLFLSFFPSVNLAPTTTISALICSYVQLHSRVELRGIEKPIIAVSPSFAVNFRSFFLALFHGHK